MDFPTFASSPALSASHYAFVRALESAQNPQASDALVVAELGALRDRLTRAGTDSRHTAEALVVLLYCLTALNTPIGTEHVEYAIPHAVTLAEAGATLAHQRIGYQFCAEVMPRAHELRLMLVNTLRKDLHANETPRVALALDFLVQSPSAETIPAIQHRLRDLLSHPSPTIRRKALYATRSLSLLQTYESQSLLRSLAPAIAKRVRDTDPSVTRAAVDACGSCLRPAGLLDEAGAKGEVKRAFVHFVKVAGRGKEEGERKEARGVVRSVLRFYAEEGDGKGEGVPGEVVRGVLGLLGRTTHEGAGADSLRLEIYRLIAHIPTATISAALVPHASTSTSTPTSSHAATSALIAPIRPLILSENPNDHHLFLECLACVDPALWAGEGPSVVGDAELEGRRTTATAFEAFEVERILGWLDSLDAGIRTKTTRILARVDPALPRTYASTLLATLPDAGEPAVLRLLELAAAMYAGAGADGEPESYARAVRDTFGACAAVRVMESAVEEVLGFIRAQPEEYAANVVTALLVPFVDEAEEAVAVADVSSLVVATALAAEYAGRVPVSPQEIVGRLVKELPRCSPSIQDAILLAMMRLAAECEVPDGVRAIVAKVGEGAGRHLQRRCTQFVALSADAGRLRTIVAGTRSRSLPDFLAALEAHQAHMPLPRSPPSSTSSPIPSSSSIALSSGSKLRYDAYAPPHAVPRRSELARSDSLDSSRSSAASGRGRGRRRPEEEEEDLARTVGPGELAVVAGSPELRAATLSHSPRISHAVRSPKTRAVEVRSVHAPPPPVDLLGSLALDSPFLSDPPSAGHPLPPPSADTRSLSSTSAHSLSSASASAHSLPSSGGGGPSPAPSAFTQTDFGATWDELGGAGFQARGWAEARAEDVVRRLRGVAVEGEGGQVHVDVGGAGEAPFVGETKVLVSSSAGRATLRLREDADTEDGGCLWRARADGETLLSAVKRALAEDG